ncbi:MULTISPECIES: hypothetical protein [unclassified Clostridium]|uniref:hypothetical protein n=1 Tax=unclassified Clostridium TaxID=2614128 RepID=UPI000297C545|nr:MULTISPECIES: hypothetical protein [unclassified Clostridium]EKQ52742.1 MAG: hypothetical protein A370_04047 [Clostridium sp. Maddingley MBC34-26]
MKLLKVKDGLLEAENFFLASPFSDFAGSANITRDISTGKLQLISDNIRIERPFPFDDFLIEVKKENFDNMENGDFSMVYLGDGNCTFGIKDEDVKTQNKYWKILRESGYVQAYVSSDGINYTNIGGMSFPDTLTKQGFDKINKKGFILDSYKLYGSPYVTLQNFPQDTICELYDTSNNLIKTRTFDSSMECRIFLDSNNLNGHLIFKDPQGSTLFTTDNLIFGYGDVWVISPYDFEVIYLGNVVTNVTPAFLQDLDEIISIKNIGSTTYTGIVVGTQTSSSDLIELSLDGITYSSTLTLDFAIGEEKQIYVKVTKNAASINFSVRDFQLVIS